MTERKYSDVGDKEVSGATPERVSTVAGYRKPEGEWGVGPAVLRSAGRTRITIPRDTEAKQ